MVKKAIEYYRAGMHVPAELTNRLINKAQLNKKEKLLVLFSYEMLPVLFELGFKNVTLLTDNPRKSIIEIAKLFGYKVITEKEIYKMQFDSIIGNPPYQGKAQLHQKFFNMAVGLLKDNGVLCFIHPATPYFNKNAIREHEKNMQENICKYITKVQIVGAEVFKGASIANDIAITVLRKELSHNNLINSFTYKNNETVENVLLDDINFMGEFSEIYKSIKNKYIKFIKKNDSLRTLIYSSYKNPINNLAKLQRIRGHMYMNDFYTFISNDSSYYTNSMDDKSDHGIKIQSMEEANNIYEYLKTFIARFGLSFRKINTNNQPSEFEMVPLVDFTKKWNDQSLAELIGLTNKELKFIRKKLPDYHDLLV